MLEVGAGGQTRGLYSCSDGDRAALSVHTMGNFTTVLFFLFSSVVLE